jgi:GNAT superfamily N-acetyltransferase
MFERHDQFWANFFGVPASDLNLSGISIVEHVGLAGYRGIWFFKHQDRLIVSAPAGWLAYLSANLKGVPEYQVLRDESFLKKLFGQHFERSIGPAYHGSLESVDFRPVTSSSVRSLVTGDSAARAMFQEACGLEAWDDSGLDEAQHLVAYFEHERITAMAGFRAWADFVGDPCVLVHPDRRSRGLGTLVVSEVVRLALLENQVLYQTLESNLAAVKLAQRLGYRRYASHVAVRLTSSVP